MLARKAAGYATQHDLAEALGCTRAAVSLWENGGTAPRDAARRELAALLNLTVAELFPPDLALVAVGEVAA